MTREEQTAAAPDGSVRFELVVDADRVPGHYTASLRGPTIDGATLELAGALTVEPRVESGGSGGPVPTPSEMPFDDVSESSFAYDDIALIYGLGITTGTSATTYSPDDYVTREQMAAFIGRLWRNLGRLCPSALSPFVDIGAASFASDDVNCLYGLGITTGTSATAYSPDDFVTREQMAAFLGRLWRNLGTTMPSGPLTVRRYRGRLLRPPTMSTASTASVSPPEHPLPPTPLTTSSPANKWPPSWPASGASHDPGLKSGHALMPGRAQGPGPPTRSD